MLVLKLKQRSNYKIAILFGVVIFLILYSWGFTQAEITPLEEFGSAEFFLDRAGRSGTETEKYIAALQQRLLSNPEDWQSYTQLGLAYLQQARETGAPSYYQKSDQAFQRALTYQPQDYATLSGMGVLALARHNFEEALEWGERAKMLDPERAYAYGVLADAQIELGRYEQAIVSLQTMVDIRPDMSSFARISYIRELHGDLHGALDMMIRAVDSGGPTQENNAWARNQLALLYFNMGDLENAEREYRRVLLAAPNYVAAMAGLGRVRAARGEVHEASQLLSQAVQTMPLPEYAILLGEFFESLNRHEEARQQYSLLEVYQQLYIANGVDIDLEMALFLADHGEDARAAVTLAQKGYARRPSIYAADVLAWSLYKVGRYKEAQEYSEQALRLGSQDAMKYFHAGMIAYQLNKTQLARRYLEKALAINPHFSLIYGKIAEGTLEQLR